MWKSAGVDLPDNYSSALRRLLSLERKFKANPEMASRYAKVINECISLGHARKLLSLELPLPPETLVPPTSRAFHRFRLNRFVTSLNGFL